MNWVTYFFAVLTWLLDIGHWIGTTVLGVDLDWLDLPIDTFQQVASTLFFVN
jgi:hypothetical protein